MFWKTFGGIQNYHLKNAVNLDVQIMLIDWVGNKIKIEKWNNQFERLYRRNGRKTRFNRVLVLRN